MTKRTSVNPDAPTISAVWQSFQSIRDSLAEMSAKVKTYRLEDSDACPPEFVGIDLRDIDEFFQRHCEEAEQQASLFLIAAAEAALRIDFLQRVDDKKRDETSRKFRRIYREKANSSRLRVRLDEDILDVWAEECPASKAKIGDFKGALNYRNWLAHGRYFVPKLGARYEPTGILSIILRAFDGIGLDVD